MLMLIGDLVFWEKSFKENIGKLLWGVGGKIRVQSKQREVSTIWTERQKFYNL